VKGNPEIDLVFKHCEPFLDTPIPSESLAKPRMKGILEALQAHRTIWLAIHVINRIF
jgi:hypothetical protein